MRIQSFALSDVGKERKLNEDYFLADPELGLYVVCDGMGGHAAGEIASSTAATSVHEHVLARAAELTAMGAPQIGSRR
jgi:serine/threonine protein phosphatase PrpC